MAVLDNYECKTSEKERIADHTYDIPIKQFLMILDMAKQMNKEGELTYENFAVSYNYFASSFN
jgi:hypothetical protein